MNKLFVYTPVVTARISYIFELIFNQILCVDNLVITSELYEFVQARGVAKINYSNKIISETPIFYPDDLLTQTGISSGKPIFKKHKNLSAAFFHSDNNNNKEKYELPFDPFSLSFYLVSRYEEYQEFKADQYGRFPATSSVAYKNRFLQQPLVNLWALEIKKIMLSAYPELEFNMEGYKYTATYDIDHAYAFLKKGIIRQAGAFWRNMLIRDGETIKLQLKTWFRVQKDPYDCFDYLDQLNNKYNLSSKYFWQIGNYGPYDKNISHNNKHFQTLIRKNAKEYPIGIHPSFGSKEHQDIVDKEIHRLEKITGERTTRSRQHFLLLQFPETYQRLVNLSIKEDYSMGYASLPGFRASIATPYYWFNLNEEKVTDLEIHPFQLMDVTFNSYLKLKPEEVLEQARIIINNTKNCGGHLISIWHNSSLCEAWQWKGWRKVYEQILEEVSRN
jgi:hypothetical protein